MVRGALSSFQTTCQVPISEKSFPDSADEIRIRAVSSDTHSECCSTTGVVHSEHTVAFLGIRDSQNGHSFWGGLESASSRNSGPKMTAWGSENSTPATALPFLADFETISTVPIRPETAHNTT